MSRSPCVAGVARKLRPCLYSSLDSKTASFRNSPVRAYHNPLEIFHKQPCLSKLSTSASLPSDQPIEEERHPQYDPAERYFARPGETINDRLEVIEKLGFGGDSSTWLVRDLDRWRWEPDEYWALKIKASEARYERKDDAQKEIKVLEHVTEKLHLLEPSVVGGLASIHLPDGSTSITGPNGLHQCILYQPMRETLSDWRNAFEHEGLPLFLIKIYVAALLDALSLLHARKVVHTEITLGNIFMTYEDASVLTTQLEDVLKSPREHKVDSKGRCVFLSRSTFPALKEPIREFLTKALPKLADFGSADIQPHDAVGAITPAQPHHYRAPEMLLGMPYSTPIDIWNLGVLLWDLVEGKALFDPMPWGNDEYDPALHVGYIYALLGRPPQTFAERVDENEFKDYKIPGGGLRWTPKRESKETLRDLFDGPHLDREGNILRPHLVPHDFDMAASITRLSGGEKEDFMRFARRLLTWDPQQRATAAELRDDPWLDPWGEEED